MKYIGPNEGLKVFDIKFDITTAGPIYFIYITP